MQSWRTPTETEVDRAVALLLHPGQVNYFFDRLENPEWLQPLIDRHLFKQPPPPQPGDAPGTMVFFAWPQSRYLARVAASKPELALGIVNEHRECENPYVISDFVEALGNISPPLIGDTVSIIESWIKKGLVVFLPERLGALVEGFAKSEMRNEALAITNTAIDVYPADKGERIDSEDDTIRLPKQPRSYLSKWDLASLLNEHIIGLSGAIGVDLFRLLCDKLKKCIRIKRERADEGLDDFSYIWRPTIEPSDQNLGSTIEDVIVDAVRDVGGALLSAENLHVVDELEAEPFPIFRRILMHLLESQGAQTLPVIERILVDRDNFENYRLRHEYALLLRKQFANLGEAAREVILDWIRQGPDLVQY